jgi:hypothetical protein
VIPAQFVLEDPDFYVAHGGTGELMFDLLLTRGSRYEIAVLIGKRVASREVRELLHYLKIVKPGSYLLNLMYGSYRKDDSGSLSNPLSSRRMLKLWRRFERRAFLEQQDA